MTQTANERGVKPEKVKYNVGPDLEVIKLFSAQLS